MAWAIFGVCVAAVFILLGMYKQKIGMGRNRNRDR